MLSGRPAGSAGAPQAPPATPDHLSGGDRGRELDHGGSDDVSAAVCLFRSLADPARLAIVRHLAASGEHRVVELTAHLGLAQSTVSQHLSCLRECGLVSARAQGRASLYSLARPELLDLLSSAEALLEATGQQVTLCPTYGVDSVEPVSGPDPADGADRAGGADRVSADRRGATDVAAAAATHSSGGE